MDFWRSDAEQLAQRGDFFGALRAVDQLLARDPGDVPALTLRSEYLRRLELHEEAVQNDRRIQSSTPDQRFLDCLARQQFYEAAQMYCRFRLPLVVLEQWQASEKRTGAVQQLLAVFKQINAARPDQPEVMMALGHLFLGLQRYNEAELQYRAILRHDLNHQEAMLALGRVCQLKGHFRDAILAFNRVLFLNPQRIEPKERLAELYLAQHLTSEALKYYLLAADACRELEQRDEAIRLYQLALGLDSSNAAAIRALASFHPG